MKSKYIINPATGRKVLKNGTIGKRLIQNGGFGFGVPGLGMSPLSNKLLKPIKLVGEKISKIYNFETAKHQTGYNALVRFQKNLLNKNLEILNSEDNYNEIVLRNKYYLVFFKKLYALLFLITKDIIQLKNFLQKEYNKEDKDFLKNNPYTVYKGLYKISNELLINEIKNLKVYYSASEGYYGSEQKIFTNKEIEYLDDTQTVRNARYFVLGDKQKNPNKGGLSKIPFDVKRMIAKKLKIYNVEDYFEDIKQEYNLYKENWNNKKLNQIMKLSDKAYDPRLPSLIRNE